jgi:hypothetical protein
VLTSLLVVTVTLIAVLTRYEYPLKEAGKLRIDRWTGVPQVWECKDLETGRGALARFRRKYARAQDIPNRELARLIAEQYPQYPNIPDSKLAALIVEKYPMYEDILGEIAAREPGAEYRCGWRPRE